jgi:hypothetical protein
MFNMILPRTADNAYRGQKVALWLFGLLLLMRLPISINSMIMGHKVLTTADGVPLDTYPPGAASTILAFFALYGLGNLVISVLSIVILVRYRSLVPFMFVLFLLYHLGGRWIDFVHPIARVGAPPAAAINLTILILIVAGVVLSLWPRRGA